MDGTSEWCSRFILGLKANGKVQLCLYPARLNKVLLRPMHRGPTSNDILPRLEGVKCLTLIDLSSGYHNLQLDEQSSYVTTFYRCIRLPFGVAPMGDMFQKKIDEFFSSMLCVFSIFDDILIAGFNELGRGHGVTLNKVSKYAGRLT